MDNEIVYIEGTVFTGRGEGEFYVNLYSKSFRKTLGINPYPGTLNLRLTQDSVKVMEKIVSRPVKIVEPPMEGFGRVYVWPGFIKCTRVYVIRPEKTVYRVDVVELVADANLRELFNLRDGDLLRVAVALKDNVLPEYCV